MAAVGLSRIDTTKWTYEVALEPVAKRPVPLEAPPVLAPHVVPSVFVPRSDVGQRLERLARDATFVPTLLPPTDSAEAAILGWPLRALHSDVQTIAEQAAKRGYPVMLATMRDTNTERTLEIGKDGALLFTSAEQTDLGHTYSGPATAQDLEKVGVLCAETLDALIKNALKRVTR